jgi:hypothetical protein
MTHSPELTAQPRTDACVPHGFLVARQIGLKVSGVFLC